MSTRPVCDPSLWLHNRVACPALFIHAAGGYCKYQNHTMGETIGETSSRCHYPAEDAPSGSTHYFISRTCVAPPMKSRGKKGRGFSLVLETFCLVLKNRQYLSFLYCTHFKLMLKSSMNLQGRIKFFFIFPVFSVRYSNAIYWVGLGGRDAHLHA